MSKREKPPFTPEVVSMLKQFKQQSGNIGLPLRYAIAIEFALNERFSSHPAGDAYIDIVKWGGLFAVREESIIDPSTRQASEFGLRICKVDEGSGDVMKNSWLPIARRFPDLLGIMHEAPFNYQQAQKAYALWHLQKEIGWMPIEIDAS